MVISLIQVGKTVAASTINAIIAAVNQTALTGIVPTSVDGTGVTLSPNGKVTFVNAPSVSLNGIFSGSFDNYRITFNSTTRSTLTTWACRLRLAGTDLTSATYDFARGYDSGTARTITSSTAAAGFLIDIGIAAGQASNGHIDIFNPGAALMTTGNITAGVLASSAIYSVQIAFANENTSAYDGITFYPVTAGGTWSGTVRVYGYNTLT